MMTHTVKWNMFGSAKKVAEWFNKYKALFVGQVDEPTDCPMKHYLKEHHPNLNDISVGDVYTTYVNNKGETVRVRNPEWVGKFVRTLDRECGEYKSDDTDPYYDDEWFDPAVTGQDALDILRKVTNYRV